MRVALRAAVQESLRSDSEIEQELGLRLGALEVILVGKVELRVAHVFGILRAAEIEPCRFFLELRAGMEAH